MNVVVAVAVSKTLVVFMILVVLVGLTGRIVVTVNRSVYTTFIAVVRSCLRSAVI